MLICWVSWSWSQIVTSDPAFPTSSGAVNIVFDASLSSGGLATYTGTDVYVHTGVITDKSTSNSDWKYATTWLNNATKYKMTSLGNKKWQLTISPDIRTFYGVPSNETILTASRWRCPIGTAAKASCFRPLIAANPPLFPPMAAFKHRKRFPFSRALISSQAAFVGDASVANAV